MNLKIRRLKPKDLIFFQVVYNFFIKWMIGTFKIPSTANYLTDVITAILFVCIIMYCINTPKNEKNHVWCIIPVVFFLYCIANWAIQGYSIIYFLWGMRNVFRFYVFFIACTLFLGIKDIYKLINLLFYLFILSAIMCVYQYLLKGYRGDRIAGYFSTGETLGGNGPMQVLMVIEGSICLIRYMEKKMSIMQVALVLAAIMIVAVIGEMKAMFLFMAVMVALASLLTRFSVKKLVIIGLIACAVPVAINALYQLFPTFNNFFTIETINNYASGSRGYTGQGDINRFSAIQYCFDNFMKPGLQRIFGSGLGSCDGSTNFKLVTTDFYKKYSETTHYSWFSVPMILLENGIIGLIFYFSFFAMVLKDATKLRKTFNENKDILICVQMLAIFGALFSFYNSVLRSEIMGYTFYAFMAIPYIVKTVQQ